MLINLRALAKPIIMDYKIYLIDRTSDLNTKCFFSVYDLVYTHTLRSGLSLIVLIK